MHRKARGNTGLLLALALPGNGVIRATTLFLVLTLAGAPAATSLCIGWCSADGTPIDMAATCHQWTREGMPGLLPGEYGCDTLPQTAPFVREDVQRVASGLTLGHAVVFAEQQVEGWLSLHRAAGPASRRPAASQAPTFTPLRI